MRLTHILSGPDLTVRGETLDVDTGLTQLSAVANRFWSIGPSNRVFLYGGFGTSFDSAPLPTNQFSLGTLFRLGAYDTGESGGLTITLRRLDTSGALAGCLISWAARSSPADGSRMGMRLTSGSAPAGKSNGGVGLVMDTIVGPVVLPAHGASTDAGARTWVSAACSVEDAEGPVKGAP